MFRNPTTDLIVVLVIVLLILGPKRLPGLGRGLGQGMREFKDSISGGSGESGESGESKDDPPNTPAITQSSTAPDPLRRENTEPAAPEHSSTEVGSERQS